MTAIAIITPTDLQSASAVLNTNISYVTKYQTKAEKLIAQAKTEGTKLTPDTDKAINDFLVSAKTCLKNMEEQRKPYTQKAQEFVKLFTTQENIINNDLYPKLQAIRDASVKAYAVEESERRKKEQLKLDKQKAEITLLADAEQQLRNGYAAILQKDKKELLHGLTVDTISHLEAFEIILKNFCADLKESEFNAIGIYLNSSLLSKEEMQEISLKAFEGKFEKVAPHYKTEMSAFAQHILTLIPNRRKEIEEGIANSKAAEELKKKQEAEALKQQQLSEQKAEEQKTVALAEAVIDSQINDARVTSSIPKVSAIEGYTIDVLKREGWAEIFKFYFTHSDEQDLGKIKLDQMKAFAEKYAKSHGVKIESDAIHYEVKYKATARKTKNAA